VPISSIPELVTRLENTSKQVSELSSEIGKQKEQGMSQIKKCEELLSSKLPQVDELNQQIFTRTSSLLLRLPKLIQEQN